MEKLSFHTFKNLNPVWDKDELIQLTEILNTKHSIYLSQEIFEVEAGFNKIQIQLQVSLKKEDGSSVYPIEIVCPCDDNYELKIKETSYTIIDYMDLYWSEYFIEERNLFLPIDWQKHECEGVSFFLRGFVRRLSLEEEADSLLKKHGHGEHEIHSISSET